MRPIVVSGFMATGKSTVGRALAARLGVPFVDTDEEVARRAGRSVPEFWQTEGETAFRALEQTVAEELLSDPTPRVIAFGGGTVTVRKVRHLALERALLVTLTASPATIAARVADLSLRPNLAVGGDPCARAVELMELRAEAYAECYLALATDAAKVDETVCEILRLVDRDPIVMPLGRRSYPIEIGVGTPGLLADAVARCAPSSVVVVTDAHVERARGHALARALLGLEVRATRVTLTPGEEHKNLSSVASVWDVALGAGVDRDALLVAFGGGVVGDMAGFAAATLLRGVRVVQAPTTLLAMVDSSVGGKTGIDHAAGKNLVGAFHQPCAVVVDLEHLTTLPRRELVGGLAEVVKVALVADGALLASLEEHATRIAAGELEVLQPVVRAAIEAKMRIVRDDERETGARALLNLGHTVGHALEAYSGYRGYIHGEAVALGTVAELRATARLGHTPPELVDRARTLLGRFGLPTDVGVEQLAACWGHVGADKKRGGGAVKLPVVTGVGRAEVERVDLAVLREALLSR